MLRLFLDISQITDDLFISARPDPDRADELHALNIGLIIDMRGEYRPKQVFREPPFSLLWLRTYDFFFTPIPMHVLEQGVRAALNTIAQGRRVLVHCQHGRHRSVAMAAAILIAQGSTAQEAMRLIKARRRVADPKIWYIRQRIEQFETYWAEHKTHDPVPGQ
jgi:protein-tyrosine phosphatase